MNIFFLFLGNSFLERDVIYMVKFILVSFVLYVFIYILVKSIDSNLI